MKHRGKMPDTLDPVASTRAALDAFYAKKLPASPETIAEHIKLANAWHDAKEEAAKQQENHADLE